MEWLKHYVMFSCNDQWYQPAKFFIVVYTSQFVDSTSRDKKYFHLVPQMLVKISGMFLESSV